MLLLNYVFDRDQNKFSKFKMIKIAITFSFSVVCISLIITSTIKYSSPTFIGCNNVFDGFIKHLEVFYKTYQKNIGLVVAKIDIYKNFAFVENYILTANLEDFGVLQEHYTNLTTINMYKNCVILSNNYFLKEIFYESAGIWQLVLAYSCFFLIISLLASALFLIQNKIKKTEGIVEPKF